ncbi:transcription elongation factor GreA [candidate division NPL-UPA2 bacterium Unc8]|uniref:Transcription elongation factor GreA n=1 Tax=candidate division NPL-UPA2 bacterium Unc8 TaxID=1980939 RepID=A0A399FVS5_UNCN2|nr:MAG: transcription elongation factor GreA [candidate division NPL-UPA2 bacterium Unc8]
MKETLLTRGGYKMLKEELYRLKTVERRELSQQIAEAKAHGDISENAEYSAAKEAQGMLEEKIRILEEKLIRVRIIDDENIATDKAYIGATLLLKDIESGEELQYTLVGEDESNFSQGKISITSPIGQGLLGYKEGDTAEIKVPAGTLRYRILKISRN